MNAFLQGFTNGFTQGMFNNMFFGGNLFNFGYFGSCCNPFCSWNTPPMFFSPMTNFNIFTPYSNPVTNSPLMNFDSYYSPIPTNKTSLFDWDNTLKNADISSTGDVFTKSTPQINTLSTSTTFTPTFTYPNFSSPATTTKSTAKANLAASSVSTNSNASKTKAKTYREMSDSERRSVYGNYTQKITDLYTGTASDLNKHLKGKLANMGQAFINAQNKYGISASVLAAICMNESGNGTSRLAREQNNVGGIRNGGKSFKSFANIEACIDEMASLLKRNYVNENLTKLYEINAKYCPVQDTEDKNNLNRLWARNVAKHLNTLTSA